MTIFLGLITAHILADFVMQSGFKENRTGTDLLGHIVAVSGMTAIVLCGLQYWGAISFSSAKVLAGVIVGIGIVHAAQDIAGATLCAHLRPYVTQLTGFVIDQVLHVVVLVGVGTLLLQQQVVAIASTSVGTYGWQAELALHTVLLAAFATSVAAVVIAYLLEPFAGQLKLPSDSKTLNAGLWIGVCERFLLVLAIASGSELFPSVGFVLTAKSIFRFRELENRVHAEYYLLGTLMSISVAVFIGLILRAMYS